MSLLSGARSHHDLNLEDPDRHILLQLDYTEKLSKNVRIRRRTIKTAIRKDSFDSVYKKMRDLKETLGREYKNKRLREDMNWLKSNSHRFNQSLF